MSVPSNTVIKSSVHTTTGISKSLLTPYRRIGLSRKSKPVQKILNSSLQEIQNSAETNTSLDRNNESLNLVNSLEECTTSQTKVLAPLEKKQEAEADRTINISDFAKSRNRKRLTKAVSMKRTNDVTNSKIARKVINKKTDSIEWLDHLQKMVVEEEQPVNTYIPPNIGLDVLEQLQSKELKVSVTRINPPHSIKRKNVNDKPQSKAKRKLSMKKNTNSCNTDFSDTDDEIGLFNCDIPLDDLRAEDATISCNAENYKDNISSQQSVEAHYTEDTSTLVDEILQLEKQVHEKEVHLNKLQQAELYHNMHNVEDLDKLTHFWKTKCQEALRDLLDKLKDHAHLDMPGLLKNLKVPSSLIDYNYEDDIFV